MALNLMIDNNTDFALLNPYDAQVTELIERYSGLTVTGIEDTEGIKACHDARMELKKVRIAVDKTGKQLRDAANAYSKRCKAEADGIIARITPLEKELQDKEDIVKREQERIAKEEAAALQARTHTRLLKLQEYGVAAMESVVRDMPEEEFAARAESARQEWEEKCRLERDQKAELARIKEQQDAVRQEQERKAAELEAKKDAIEADERRIEAAKAAEVQRLADIEAEKKRAEQIEKAKQEAAVAAAQAERERLERERLQAKEEAERVERERMEELESRPYKQKLNALADQVERLDNPAGKYSPQIAGILSATADEIRKIAKKR